MDNNSKLKILLFSVILLIGCQELDPEVIIVKITDTLWVTQMDTAYITDAPFRGFSSAKWVNLPFVAGIRVESSVVQRLDGGYYDTKIHIVLYNHDEDYNPIGDVVAEDSSLFYTSLEDTAKVIDCFNSVGKVGRVSFLMSERWDRPNGFIQAYWLSYKIFDE